MASDGDEDVEFSELSMLDSRPRREAGTASGKDVPMSCLVGVLILVQLLFGVNAVVHEPIAVAVHHRWYCNSAPSFDLQVCGRLIQTKEADPVVFAFLRDLFGSLVGSQRRLWWSASVG